MSSSGDDKKKESKEIVTLTSIKELALTENPSRSDENDDEPLEPEPEVQAEDSPRSDISGQSPDLSGSPDVSQGQEVIPDFSDNSPHSDISRQSPDLSGSPDVSQGQEVIPDFSDNSPRSDASGQSPNVSGSPDISQAKTIAATKIQATFRGWQLRKIMAEGRILADKIIAARKIQATFRGWQLRKIMKEARILADKMIAAKKIPQRHSQGELLNKSLDRAKPYDGDGGRSRLKAPFIRQKDKSFQFPESNVENETTDDIEENEQQSDNLQSEKYSHVHAEKNEDIQSESACTAEVLSVAEQFQKDLQSIALLAENFGPLGKYSILSSPNKPNVIKVDWAPPRCIPSSPIVSPLEEDVPSVDLDDTKSQVEDKKSFSEQIDHFVSIHDEQVESNIDSNAFGDNLEQFFTSS